MAEERRRSDHDREFRPAGNQVVGAGQIRMARNRMPDFVTIANSPTAFLAASHEDQTERLLPRQFYRELAVSNAFAEAFRVTRRRLLPVGRDQFRERKK